MQERKDFEFEDAAIRRAFIRKVYSILMLQLLITLGVVAVFTLHGPTKKFAHENLHIFWIALIVSLVLVCAMACSTDVRRKTPMNYIYLFAFTIAEATVVGFLSSFHKEEYVMFAVGITAVICFALTAFAFQTKIDFTGFGPYLFVLLIVLIIYGTLVLIWPNKIFTLIYCSCGALLFSFYLIYDTQLMLGGKHKYALSPEEYIFAALNLYLDIINIFLYILSIISASNRD